MNIKALLDEFQTIKSAHEGRTITAEQSARLAVLPGEIQAAKAAETAIAEGEALLAGVKSAGSPHRTADEDDAPAKSLGEHFVKSADGHALAKGTFEAPEFKAVADPTAVGSEQINDVDRELVKNTRVTPSVASLFSQGTVSGNGVSYRVEQPVEGTITAVAEGKPKAKVQFRYELRREGISTIAGYTEITDDMTEDLDYVASEINGDLQLEVEIAEDRELLNGDGVGVNPLGVLNREGVQVVAAADKSDNIDAIHRAATVVSIASNRPADYVVINPLDWEGIELAKDANGQYLGGGPFLATLSRGIWSIPAIVTTAIPQGTALVGAFKAGGKVLRKGGIRVKSTDSHNGHFVEGITTIVASKRVGLKVGKPAAFAKVTLSPAAPAA